MSVRHIALITVLLLAIGALPAAAAPAPSGCPAIMPTSEVREGMTGTGLTVVRGSQPVSFSVEVLGVLRDAVAPGRDLIVVQAQGADIARRGIWAGMSGSPVTVGGRLIGAVAYGLTLGPSDIAGLTPAEDLMDVLTLSDASSGAMTEQNADNPPRMREEIAERHDMAPQEVGSRFARLKTPLAVSGVSQRSMQRLTEVIERTGAPLVPYLGASAAAVTTTATATPTPGGNLAGVLSYGDVTAAAIGTTTYVCDGRMVGFGHPFLFSGAAALGANDANALTIVTDPSFGSFKLAQVTEAFGTLDQDRLSGVRVALGALPPLAPVTSTVRAHETGRSRTGTTQVAAGAMMPFLAFLHALSNIDATVDRIGGGSSTLSWSAEGVRTDGSPWRLRRVNRFAGPGDIAIDTTLELLGFLAALQENPYEEIDIRKVQLDAAVEPTVRRSTIEQVLVGVDAGEPVPISDGVVVAAPGSTIEITAVLAPYRSTERRSATLSLQVPEDATGDGFLSVTAGNTGFDPFLCIFDPQACAASGGGTFDGMLALLQDAPRNDELVGTLSLFGVAPPVDVVEDGEQPADEPPPALRDPSQALATAKVRLDQVAVGAFGVPVLIGDGSGLTRLAGADRVATAVELSRFTHPEGADTVVVARADQPADSLAAAPLAASLGAPLLLTAGDRLSSAVAEEVGRLGVTSAVLLGGPAALGEAVVQGLRAAGVAEVERVAGRTRYDTARLVARRLGASEAVLVNGDGSTGWADAVSAAAHAAASGRALLLAMTDALPSETATALDGMGDVLAVGGPAVLSEQVLAGVRARGAAVRRLAGADRYATAVTLAAESEQAGADGTRTWVASGHRWADALAAGAAAAADGGVLVLTDPQDLGRSAPTAAWLRERLPDVRLVGGLTAISAMVEQQIAELLFGFPPNEPDGPGAAVG